VIGLPGLPDGAAVLQHPHGPIWLLIRDGQIVRAETYDRDADALVTWTATGEKRRPGAYAIKQLLTRKGVRPAD